MSVAPKTEDRVMQAVLEERRERRTKRWKTSAHRHNPDGMKAAVDEFLEWLETKNSEPAQPLPALPR